MKTKQKACVTHTDASKILGGGICGVRKPMTRIYEIHRAILSGNYPNCFELAAEMDLDRKTILRDINFMRSELGMPIVYEETRHGYYYSGPVPSFPVFQSSAEEIASLFIARNALESIRGTDLAETLRRVFVNLTRGMCGKVEITWADLDQAFSRKLIEQNTQIAEIFGELSMAILRQKVTSFQYQKLGAEESELRKVRPLHLSEVEGGCYLIAHDINRKALRTFALPRISALKVTKRTFDRPLDFNAADHLAKSFGIWHTAGDASHYLVKVELKNYAARIAQERRWHPSQEVKPLNTKGTKVEICFEVSRLEDVLRWVMSFGSNAKVIAPPELAEMVRAEVVAMSKG